MSTFLLFPVRIGLVALAFLAKTGETVVCHANVASASRTIQRHMARDIQKGHQLLREQILAFLENRTISNDELRNKWLPLCVEADAELEKQSGGNLLDADQCLESLLLNVIDIKNEAKA